jgi:hypothetical protein
MLAPIPVLFVCFLVVIFVDAEQVPRAVASGADRVLSGELKQNRQETPPGKRRPVHEYSPEDVLPETDENENSRAIKSQTQRRRVKSKLPVASIQRVTPVQKVTPSPTPVPPVQPSKAIFTSPTPIAITKPAPVPIPSLPREAEKSGTSPWKLPVFVFLFLLALGSLVFVVAKLIQQRRADKQAIEGSASENRRSDPIGQLLGSGREVVADNRIKPSGKFHKGVKNRIRKAHN